MLEIKDLKSTETRVALQRTADEIKNCMCCTDAKEVAVKSRTQGTSWVDDDGNFWFLCRKYDWQNPLIASGNHIELIYSEPGQAHLLTVYGTGTLANSREKLEQRWQVLDRDWFPLGISDPDIVLIKVSPKEAYYKDGRFGHMVALMNPGRAA